MRNKTTYSRVNAVIEGTDIVISSILVKNNGTEEVSLKTEKVKKRLTPQQKLFLNRRDEFKSHCNYLGGFIHMIYTKNEILFSDANIDKANVSRIIYLATFMDYEQKGLIVYQPKSKEGKFLPNEPMTKKLIQTTLGLGDTSFKKFLKDMKNNSIMFEVDKKFYIDTNYFIKGEVENFNGIEQSYCRLFIDIVRNLYEGCKPTQHKVLANIYQLVPFIHYSNNMLCHNPNELEDTAEPMSLNDIGQLLNISDNKGNLKKLVKDLDKFYITTEDKEYKVFSYIRMTDKDFYFVNPYVIYSGNDVQKLKWVANTYFFR